MTIDSIVQWCATLAEKVNALEMSVAVLKNSQKDSDKVLNKYLQLEKEADWLAGQCEMLSGYNRIFFRKGKPKSHWRDFAREVAKNDK